MKGFIKWTFLCAIIASFLVVSIHAHPTATSLVKRKEDIDIKDFHNTGSTTTTSKSSKSTSTPKKDSGNSAAKVIAVGGASWYVAVYGTASGIAPQMASLGAILIVLGLVLTGMGYRLARIMLAIMGLLTFGSLTWIILANCRPQAGYTRDSILMIVVPVGVGIVGAVGYYIFWTVAMYLAAAFGGFLLGVFILSWGGDLLIVNVIGRSCFLAAMALVAGIAVYFAERLTMLFATSFVGAYIFFFGIDCLARVGYIAAAEKLLNANVHHLVEYELGTFIYVLLAMTLVMFIGSFIWQFIFNAAIDFASQFVAAAKSEGGD